MSEPLAEQLRSLLAEALDDPGLRVGELRQLTGGASAETWAFRVERSGGGRRELILRRDPRASARDGGGVTREATAIEAAAAAGVPEPRLIAYSDDPTALGAPFVVMELVAGETLPRRILSDPEYDRVRPLLAERCGEILARIHGIDPRRVAGLPAPDPLARLRADLDRFDDPSPAFELGLRWLEQNRPPSAGTGLVHGDFRNGNLVVDPDGIRAVLDWELVHLGDPLEDLGYLCARCWRFGVVGRPVGGFGAYADLLRGYQRVAGVEVDLEAVRWWELLGCLRWGVGCMEQAWRHLSGSVRSIELAAIGRRAWEQEYDVLLLLGEMRAAA